MPTAAKASSWFRHSRTWPRAGDPTYVVIASEEGKARLESRIKDIRTYTEFAVAPAALLAQVFRDKDLEELSVRGHRMNGPTRTRGERRAPRSPASA
jgi:hypothetical protein